MIDLSGAIVTADSGITQAAAEGIRARTAALVGVRDGGAAKATAAGAHAAFVAATAALGKAPSESLVGVVGNHLEVGRDNLKLHRRGAAVENEDVHGSV